MIKLDVEATIKDGNVKVKSTGKISGNYEELKYEVVDVLQQIDSASSELLCEAFGIFLEEKMDNENDD